jgi:hypothetical protein
MPPLWGFTLNTSIIERMAVVFRKAARRNLGKLLVRRASREGGRRRRRRRRRRRGMDSVARAQVLLTAWDSSMSQARRDRESIWHEYEVDCRAEDVDFMASERAHRREDTMMQEKRLQ